MKQLHPEPHDLPEQLSPAEREALSEYGPRFSAINKGAPPRTEAEEAFAAAVRGERLPTTIAERAWFKQRALHLVRKAWAMERRLGSDHPQVLKQYEVAARGGSLTATRWLRAREGVSGPLRNTIWDSVERTLLEVHNPANYKDY